jgi:hypothetical protein
MRWFDRGVGFVCGAGSAVIFGWLNQMLLWVIALAVLGVGGWLLTKWLLAGRREAVRRL